MLVAPNVYKQMFVVGVSVLLLLHEGRVLEKAELQGGNAPPQPGGAGGGGGRGGGRGQLGNRKVEPGRERFHAAIDA